MGLWDDSLRIFKCLCANAQQSIGHLARQTGLSKSSAKGYRSPLAGV
jgi:DNA-binding IclR family transcriptional regulator